MAEKSVKQLMNDRMRQKAKINNMQFEIKKLHIKMSEEKKVLKSIRVALQNAKSLMSKTEPGKKVKTMKKIAVKKTVPDYDSIHVNDSIM
jgi:hypothetical protein